MNIDNGKVQIIRLNKEEALLILGEVMAYRTIPQPTGVQGRRTAANYRSCQNRQGSYFTRTVNW
jgi:hypothetical protein